MVCKRFLGLLVVLLVAGCLCPPKGPWPLPPWCEGSTIVVPGVNVPLPGQNQSGTSAVPNASSGGAPLVPILPVVQPPVHQPKQNLTASVMVTVPYWTQGDVYIGVADNPSFLKLDKVNDVVFNGTVTLEAGSSYYYSQGSTSLLELPQNRSLVKARTFDAVIDWAWHNKSIVKKDFQKSYYLGACHSCGVSFTKGNFIEPFKVAMDDVKAGGANWVNFVPVWFIIPDYRGTVLKPIYREEFTGMSGWVHATITDDELVTLIEEAHKRGLKVYLAPHVAPEDWGPDVPGKGNLMPSDPSAFFESYTDFINHYADIAQANGVEMFSIGNELDTLTQPDLRMDVPFDKDSMWRGVIKSVRERYSGLLTYSVSCIDERRCGPDLITFWDALDIIGFEWYVPIATQAHEPISSMRANAERIIEDHVEVLHNKYGKPVVFTEFGWGAYPGVCANTYGVGPSLGGDRVEQTTCFEALFQAIEGKDFIQGVQTWTWTANLPGTEFAWVNTDSVGEVRFSITEKELQKWYTKIETD